MVEVLVAGIVTVNTIVGAGATIYCNKVIGDQPALCWRSITVINIHTLAITIGRHVHLIACDLLGAITVITVDRSWIVRIGAIPKDVIADHDGIMAIGIDTIIIEAFDHIAFNYSSLL